ncbi:MAG: LysR family transcriptional regulator [Gammaproteobacteria bacterium]|nr:LysR family transcriptional regulator [Gammaproteobacteria bacterium]
MSSDLSRLPLRRLVVFEAAARHGRFVAAAQELAMSQAAVSQHMAALEAELGSALFTRAHRGVALTPTGEALRLAVEEGLRTLQSGVSAARRPGRKRTLQILTDFGFAAWWLMPRIASLSDVAPDVELRLITTQSDNAAEDPGFDLAILFGGGDWPGYRAERLFQEKVYPVCSPAYLGDRPLPTPAEISRMRLLHLRSPSAQRWFTWNDWFAAMQRPPIARPHGLLFNNYQLLLQAALQGQGVGLGWTPLIDAMVESGSLVRLSPTPLTSERGYFVVEPGHSAASDHVQAFKRLLFGPPAPR